MLNKFLLKSLIIIALAASFVSCSDSDNDSSQNARLTVRLTDAPGDYEAVYIDVQDVMINSTGEEETGWESLEGVNTGVYNLLELTGGLNVLLADNQLPAGELKQIRLVLGEDNSVKKFDEEPVFLDTPSALQSGLKVQVNETLEAGYTYDIMLDFDVDASVVEAGASGIFNLKPVIRASAVATSGIISGTVMPSDFQVKASVMSEGEEISAYADENGAFMIYGVPAGVYDVMIDPDPSKGYNNAVVAEVTVVNGETTTLEPVELAMLEDAANVTGSVTNEGVSFTAVMSAGEGESLVEYGASYGENGSFTFYGIPAGTYTLEISTPEGSEVSGTSLEVTVEAGILNELEPITL